MNPGLELLFLSVDRNHWISLDIGYIWMFRMKMWMCPTVRQSAKHGEKMATDEKDGLKLTRA